MEGRHTTHAGDRLELSSDTEIILRCGDNMVRLSPSGVDIISAGTNISSGEQSLSVGEESVDVATKGARLLMNEQGLAARTKDGASVGMGKEVRIDGEQILLNSPVEANEPAPPETPPPTVLHVVDQHGRPVPSRRVTVTLTDGREVAGILDRGGQLSLNLPEGDVADVAFEDLAHSQPD